MSGLRFNVAAWRKANPTSRATRQFTQSGSGSSVRRYTCVCCLEVVATESAKWRPTKRAAELVAAHQCAASEPYMFRCTEVSK